MDQTPPQFETWMHDYNNNNNNNNDDEFSITNPFHPINFDLYDFDDNEYNNTNDNINKTYEKAIRNNNDNDKIALLRLEQFKPFSPLRKPLENAKQILEEQLPRKTEMQSINNNNASSTTMFSSPSSLLTERDVIRNDVRSATVRLLGLLSHEEDQKRHLQNENISLKHQLKQAIEKLKHKDLHINQIIAKHKKEIEKLNDNLTIKLKKEQFKIINETTKKIEASTVNKKRYEELQKEMEKLKLILEKKKKIIKNMVRAHNESSKTFEREKQIELKKIKDRHKKELAMTIEEIERAAMDAVKNVHMAHIDDDNNSYYEDDDSEYEDMAFHIVRKLPFEIGSAEGLWPIPPEEQLGDGNKAMQQLKNPIPIQSPNSKRRLSLHQM